MRISLFCYGAIIYAAVLCGCIDCKDETAPVEVKRSVPLTLSAPESLGLKGVKDIPFCKNIDLNTIRIVSKDDLNKLFSVADEFGDINEKIYDPPNKLMKGKIFTISQRIKGVPVYGAMIVVETFDGGLLRNINYSFSANARKTEKVQQNMPDNMKKRFPGIVGKVFAVIYDPALYNKKGGAVAAWIFDTVSERYLIEQQSGKILLKHSRRPAGKK